MLADFNAFLAEKLKDFSMFVSLRKVCQGCLEFNYSLKVDKDIVIAFLRLSALSVLGGLGLVTILVITKVSLHWNLCLF